MVIVVECGRGGGGGTAGRTRHGRIRDGREKVEREKRREEEPSREVKEAMVRKRGEGGCLLDARQGGGVVAEKKMRGMTWTLARRVSRQAGQSLEQDCLTGGGETVGDWE